MMLNGIKESGLSPADQAEHMSASKLVASRMPPAAFAAMSKDLFGINYASDSDNLRDNAVNQVRRIYANAPDKAEARANETHQSLTEDPATGLYHAGRVTVDSLDKEFQGRPGKFGATGGTPQGTLAHELTHSIDAGKGMHSGTPEWQNAFKGEVAGGQLTRYAATMPSEGFAEFGRLLYGSDIPHAEIVSAFPKASAYFKSKGLWPRPRAGTAPAATHAEGGQMLPEAFGKRIQLPGGEANHADGRLSTTGLPMQKHAELYAYLERFCGGKGGTRGPCGKGRDNAHKTMRAHANAAAASAQETGKKLAAAQDAHANANFGTQAGAEAQDKLIAAQAAHDDATGKAQRLAGKARELEHQVQVQQRVKAIGAAKTAGRQPAAAPPAPEAKPAAALAPAPAAPEPAVKAPEPQSKPRTPRAPAKPVEPTGKPRGRPKGSGTAPAGPQQEPVVQKPAVTPERQRTVRNAVREAYNAHASGTDGLIHLDSIYATATSPYQAGGLPSMTKEEFQQAAQQMRGKGEIELQTANNPRSAGKMSIKEGDNNMAYAISKGQGRLQQESAIAPQTSAVTDAHVGHVVDAVQAQGRGSNLAPLENVREHLASKGITIREHQDAAIQEARKRGLVTGSNLEGRHRVTPAAKAASIPDDEPGRHIGHLSIKEGSAADTSGPVAEHVGHINGLIKQSMDRPLSGHEVQGALDKLQGHSLEHHQAVAKGVGIDRPERSLKGVKNQIKGKLMEAEHARDSIQVSERGHPYSRFAEQFHTCYAAALHRFLCRFA